MQITPFTLMAIIPKRDNTGIAIAEPARPGRARFKFEAHFPNDAFTVRNLIEEHKPTYIVIEYCLGTDYDAQTAEATLTKQYAAGQAAGVAAMLGYDVEAISRRKWHYQFFGGQVARAEFDARLRQKFAFCMEGYQFTAQNALKRDAAALACHMTLQQMAEQLSTPRDLAALMQGP